VAPSREKKKVEEILVTTCYRFTPLASEKLGELKAQIEARGASLGVLGLILLAPEGINLTASAPPAGMVEFKEFLSGIVGAPLEFKDSYTTSQPFRRLKVDLRPEIVTLMRPDLVPAGENNHLTPAEWQQVLEGERDYVLIDTRNFYETAIGKFHGAVDPGLKHFSEFPEYVRNCGIPRDKKVLMYCTGGIRCEKASLEMQSQGYEQVYQLSGGILKYLEEFPDSRYEGECFVFDHRVAVDQALQPTTQYRLCPHCGNPARENISCALCGEHCIVCAGCLADEKLRTCSKNCAHHYARE
jgi:UPF0176 protein